MQNDLARAAKYYKELDHQDKAWAYLEGRMKDYDFKIHRAPGTTLKSFLKKYRQEHKDVPNAIDLAVPHYIQKDNNTDQLGAGSIQCNTTCSCMLLDYLTDNTLAKEAAKAGEREPEAAFDDFVAKYGKSGDHNAQTQALEEWGVRSYWSTSLTIDFLIKSLEKKVPVQIGVAYKKSGHIILVKGYDYKEKEFIVNDPYGVRKGASDVYETWKSGANDIYSTRLMHQIWDIGPNSTGWGRVVTAVYDQPTGVEL